MSMDICSETVHKIRNQEVIKINKINMQKVSSKLLTRKDLPRKLQDLISTRKFKLIIGLRPYKKKR